MLVLTRKEGQEIVLAETIRLTVLSIRGNHVRLGIAAPADVPVLRNELRPTAEDVGTPAVRPAASEGKAADATAAPAFSPGPPDVEQLQAEVKSRLAGRVRRFRLAVRGCGLVLTGRARTYHAKQLAQHAVMAATRLPILANEIEVS